MIKKHVCSNNCFSKKIAVTKTIDGDMHEFLVWGNCCKICGEITIRSSELKLLEKRIKAYEELMLIVTNYRKEEKI